MDYFLFLPVPNSVGPDWQDSHQGFDRHEEGCGTRGTKANPVEGNHMLFSLLTTGPNAEVGAVHEKAMPVCLLTEQDRELWMQGEAEEALTLQRPALDGTLRVVGRGKREDG
jgi:putative SOS response-associated peptidase YedK